jgi:AsmA protein
MLSVEKVRLGVKLRPLLARRIEIVTAELTRPQLLLAVNRDGRDNWSDLGKQSASGTQSASSDAMPMTISVSGLRLNDGSLRYTDQRDGTELSLSDLRIGTGSLQLAAPIDINGSFVFRSGQTLQARATISGSATIDPDHNNYSMNAPQLAVNVSGKGLPKSGIDARLLFRELRADLKAQTLQAPGLDLSALGARLTGDLVGRSIVDAPHFTGGIKLDEVSLRELMPKLDIVVPATSDPKVLQRLRFSGDLDATTKSVQLNRLKLLLDDSTVTGSAAVADLETLAMTFNLAINRLNLDRYLASAPTAKSAAASAAGAVSPPVELPIELIRGLNLRGAVSLDSATIAAMKLSKISLGLNARDGKLHVFPSEAQLYGGQYRGDINIDASGSLPTASFNEQVSGVDFARLFADWFATKKISGRGNFTVRGVARGKDSAALLRTLTGALSAKVDNGAFEGTDLWYEIRRADALLHKRSPPDRSGPERTVFSALSATGKLDNGVLTTADINALTRALKVSGGGTVDLVKSQLNLNLNAAVQKLQDDPNVADTADVVGFVVPLTVSGALADPKVRPDLGSLAKAAVKQKLEEKKQEVEQQLRDKLQDKLKGLFGN